MRENLENGTSLREKFRFHFNWLFYMSDDVPWRVQTNGKKVTLCHLVFTR